MVVKVGKLVADGNKRSKGESFGSKNGRREGGGRAAIFESHPPPRPPAPPEALGRVEVLTEVLLAMQQELAVTHGLVFHQTALAE